MDLDRRAFVKKGAAAGVAVWATPAVITLAQARAVGSAPSCVCGAGQGTGTGLIVNGTPFGAGTCLVGTSLLGVSASVVGGTSSPTACTGQASVAGLHLPLPGGTLDVGVLTSCAKCGSGSSTIANATFTPTGGAPLPVNVLGSCNASLTVTIGGTPTTITGVTFNEQTCDANGRLTVSALHVQVAGLDVVAARSTAEGCGCPCAPCSSAPQCAPPTGSLC